MKKKTGMKTAAMLGAAAAAAVVGIAMVPTVADAAPIQKMSHVLAGYQKAVYRGDWYNHGYNYGEPAPTRGFWGKGTSGSHPQYGHGGHHRHR